MFFKMSQPLTFYEYLLLVPCSVSHSEGPRLELVSSSPVTMEPRCIVFNLLCSLFFLSPGYSSEIQCKNTQYEWPVRSPTLCCDMCPPGKVMKGRSETECKILCISCPADQYIDYYNTDMSCIICNNCQKQNMLLKSACNATHNAVCTCKPGYTCNDQTCSKCLPIPTTTKPTSTTPEMPSTTYRPHKHIRDTVWFLVIIALLCAGIALVIVTKIKPFLQWLRSKHGYFLTVKPAPVPQFAEDEEVSKPVQEVCGKCDQPIDV